MSRSRRKFPAHGITTARSDKPFKTAEHRRERHAVRNALVSGADGDDPRLHQVYGDPWLSPKDGKSIATFWPPSHFDYECAIERPKYLPEKWWNHEHPNHYSKRVFRK